MTIEVRRLGAGDLIDGREFAPTVARYDGAERRQVFFRVGTADQALALDQPGVPREYDPYLSGGGGGGSGGAGLVCLGVEPVYSSGAPMGPGGEGGITVVRAEYRAVGGGGTLRPRPRAQAGVRYTTARASVSQVQARFGESLIGGGRVAINDGQGVPVSVGEYVYEVHAFEEVGPAAFAGFERALQLTANQVCPYNDAPVLLPPYVGTNNNNQPGAGVRPPERAAGTLLLLHADFAVEGGVARVVYTLAYAAGGWESVRWELEDERGNPVASGEASVYRPASFGGLW